MSATHHTLRGRIDPFRAAEMHREALFDRLHWQPEPVVKPQAPEPRKGFFACLLAWIGGATLH